ncbi:MAG: ABC transporter permease [Sphingobacteriales bacterium]|jgi:ABC-2 type transport system permease protein|nr:MAG: ABC transporter permease [Sphingobacteriales bacterium]
MWQLLQIELFKIFRKPRTYISFGAIAAMVLIIQVALKFDGRSYIEFVLGSLKDSLEIPFDNILNGFFICFVILNLLLIHIPLLIALVAGDLVAGEANMGTLRLLATKPISRTQLMLAKFFAATIYTAMLLLWMALLALALSIYLFDTNDIIVARNDVIEVIKKDDVLWRYIAAFGYATVALTTVAALAFLLSIFADNSIGPIVATISIVIVFTILSEMQIPLYDRTVKPYLFTSHMLAWKGFFYLKTDGEGTSIPGSIENLPAVLKSMAVLLSYIVLFVGAAISIFKRKDILS